MLTTYELPLNERIRTFLRLEFLLKQSNYTLRGVSTWDSRFTISSILEINSLLSRIDINSEIGKEINRQKKALNAWAALPEVDESLLYTIMNQLEQCNNDINHYAPNGEVTNELLKSIQQRDSMPGGSCDFDMPVYHHWLSMAAELRIQQLESWLNQFEPYRTAITLLLKNLRESAVANPIATNDGFYQQALDSKSPYQLVRVSLPADAQYYPELSGGKHRFSVRFMLPSIDNKPQQVDFPIDFKLTCCLL